jgi:tetratricopeptide (TPR) repeat protein
VSNALILEIYSELVAKGNLNRYGQKLSERYSEGTLQRLLKQTEPRVREAALVGMRLIGTMESNAAVAACLRDEQPNLQRLAEDALWAIWFRADREENNQELQRIAKLIVDQEYAKALAGLNALLLRAPGFAEAYNQRAIVYWRWGNFKSSIADCEQVLKLNPYHFGAQAGMAQCYLQLKKPVEALKAFQQTHRIHPSMSGIEDSIDTLEQYLKEQRRRKDDRA